MGKYLKMKNTAVLPRKQRVLTACENYNVSRSTMWRYIKEGKLTTTKPSPRVTLLDTEQLEAFFNNEVA